MIELSNIRGGKGVSSYDNMKVSELKTQIKAEMIDLNKIDIIEDEEVTEIRGGFGRVITTSSIRANILKELTEIQNKIKYAGDYLQYEELYKLNCQLEILRRVLG